MSEIICRNCQTANPADNKFCTKCGNRLKPDTHLVCPSCYHRNGLNRLHCENCGTRLISNAPLNIEGPAGNRQTVSAPDDKNQPENDELDWLLSGQDVDIEDEKQVTDWLTKLKDSKPLAPLDTEPVNPFAQEGRVEPLEPDESVSLPDWLNDTAVSPDTSPQTAPPPDEELPSWLVGHASASNDDLDLDREGILGREDDVDWLGMLGAEPAIPEPEPEPDAPTPASFANAEPDAGDDDWLTSDEALVSFDFEEEEEEPEGTSTGFTKWLTPESVDEFETNQSEADELDDLFSPEAELPSWLDASSEADDAEAESEADDFLSALGLDESEADEDDALTNWLADTSQPEREETPSSTSLPEPAHLHDEDEDEEEIPAWLNPSSEESRATPSLGSDPSLTNWLEADESQTETAEDLPDWLREPTLGTSEPDTAVGTGFTAWLQEDKSPP
ncbi:MAG: zinc ribbon domain-containing protein, partial [Anaerolineales bacterium]|nr:zinc ribbon domain-containing protein [Anaerolineales bacterium]